MSQCEENRLAYIELSKVPGWFSGIVRIRTRTLRLTQPEPDLLMRQAFMLRALAYVQANVIRRLIHDQWIERLKVMQRLASNQL